MPLDTPATNDNTPIDPSIYWERSGVLARASAQGALFSLYLAMQQHSVAEPFQIESANSSLEQQNSVEAQLASLNYYRRPSLAASESEWKTMHVMPLLVAQDYATARLYMALKPAPLAQTNDEKRLPDDVIHNCSLGTQKRLKKQYANSVKEDNTLLYDILSSQHGETDSANPEHLNSTSFRSMA